MRARILAPLGMTSTAITLSPEMKARLAAGHNATLQPVANWDLSALAGAGALRSSTNDMLTFLAASLGYVKTPLAPAMAEMLAVRRPTTSPNMTIGLAWHMCQGRTARKSSGTTAAPAATGRSSVSIRARASAWSSCRTRALPPARTTSAGISWTPSSRSWALGAGEDAHGSRGRSADAGKYVGRYQLAPQAIITMTREGGRLFTQLTGQPKFEVFAESDKDFFLKVVDAQLTFETDAAGKAVAVVLHQNGANQRAPRIEGEPVVPKGITLDAGRARRLRRALSDAGATYTITREGTQLFAQISGQPRAEIFARSATEFFYTVVDAQITFERDAQGKATALVLHQMGRDLRWTRVE